MLALQAAAVPPHVALVDAPTPTPLPHEALVAVRSFSLNRGEVLDLTDSPSGAAVGWDLAGNAGIFTVSVAEGVDLLAQLLSP